jgi:hypothetical protein
MAQTEICLLALANRRSAAFFAVYN